MANRKQPEIRFSGYTDDWEQGKLKDVFDVHTDFVSNGSFQSLKDNVKLYNTENYAYMIRLQDASNNWKGPWLYTDKKGFVFLDKSVVYENDIIMSDRGTIGKFFLVPNLDKPMTLSSNAVLLRSSNNDNNFIYYMLNTINIGNQIRVRTTPGVQPMISKTEFKKISSKLPDFEEQQKIGVFFKQLDTTIALHQRKLDLLKEQKKGFLQKMFPKPGENTPEVRFAGFTDDWEESQLSDGTSKIGDGLHGTPNYTETGDVHFINGNNLINGKIVITEETKRVTSAEQSKNDKELNKNTLLMSINGTIGNLAWYSGEKIMLGKSAAYITVSTFDGKFIYSYLQTSKVRGHFMNSLTGTTIKNLGLKAIRETQLLIPEIEEQQKIGAFFKQLDDTIALNQKELDILKETKKGFLQKMFV